MARLNECPEKRFAPPLPCPTRIFPLRKRGQRIPPSILEGLNWAFIFLPCVMPALSFPSSLQVGGRDPSSFSQLTSPHKNPQRKVNYPEQAGRWEEARE